MASGYSAKPLYRKLGLKEGYHIQIVHPPANYAVLIGEIYGKLHIHKRSGIPLDFIHFFPRSIAELELCLPLLKKEIKKDGMIWISWYKISSGIITELSENLIRDSALANGLVDTKVCAVDETWSGLKLVFRLKDR